eukprot:TRINITY_DN9478_c0_g1_i1.p1 TRINITY_DN9478_c0_g1~~TRINITY_DN9478_c0_g1_i1.p1  ORF type:complete len:526 (+),score=168.79 TRINITY_DN9478_c0_g1_i1:118-1695(+)
MNSARIQSILESLKSESVRDSFADSPEFVAVLDAFVAKDAIAADLSSAEAESAGGAAAVLEALTLMLRVFRNMCANCPANQDRLRERHFDDVVGRAVALILPLSSPAPTDVAADALRLRWQRDAVRAALGLLCNFVTANAPNQQLVWQRFFPTVFSAVLGGADRSAVGTGALLLYNCIANHPARRAELASDKGVTVCRHLLMAIEVESETHDDAFEWIYFAFLRIFRDDLLPSLYAALGPPPEPIAAVSAPEPPLDSRERLLRFINHMADDDATDTDADVAPTPARPRPRPATSEQVRLLKLVDAAASRVPASDLGYVATPHTCRLLTRELGQRCSVVFLNSTLRLSGAGSPASSSFSPPATVDGDSLDSVGSMAASLESVAASASGPESAPADVEALMTVLDILGKVTSLGDDMAEKAALMAVFHEEELLVICVGLLERAWVTEQHAKSRGGRPSNSQAGFKQQLITVIGNLCHRCRAAQDKARELNVIPLLLNHCNLDDNNPCIQDVGRWCLLVCHCSKSQWT